MLNVAARDRQRRCHALRHGVLRGFGANSRRELMDAMERIHNTVEQEALRETGRRKLRAARNV